MGDFRVYHRQEMQRGMVDTVTDIIAGNTGALTYCIILAVLICSGRLAERENT